MLIAPTWVCSINSFSPPRTLLGNICSLYLPFVAASNFFGKPTSFVQAVDDGAVGELRRLYRDWPFFRAFIENLEMTLAKTSIEIARGYLRLVPEGAARDRYGRRLVHCHVGGQDLGAAMVAAGAARAYLRYGREYAGAEITAREAGRGIWQGSFADPEAVRRRGRRP